MGNNYKKDKDKTERFYLKNKKLINGFFNSNSTIFNIEFEDSDISKLFDQYCGMDYVIKKGKNVFGLAARVNFNSKHHKHITIRYLRKNGYETEYSKRVRQIKNKSGAIYASITMQIDAVEDEILRVIIFESNELYLHIDKNLKFFEENYMKVCSYDGNKFFEIGYKDVLALSEKYNFKVKVIEF